MSPLFQSIVRGATPRNVLPKGFQWMMIVVLVLSLFAVPVQSVQASTIPTFSIISIVSDSTVTIQTYNFPANVLFTVRMGEYGTLGIGGVVVAQTNSGAGGSFQETYTIPDSLKGKDRIALRMDGAGGYYAYNWFQNIGASPATPVPGGYAGIPTFSIKAVDPGKTVTILTKNFPANKLFTVRMGAYGTKGVGGTVVATTNSGAGGAFEATYDIPSGLASAQRIAIRMDAPGGFFAYNWFWNTSGTVATPGGPTPIPGYSGIPTFNIKAVVRDSSVTIITKNFPKDLEFTVRMGAYGTKGVGGTVVATTNSGAGGAFEATYSIPAGLVGAQRIAIRMDAPGGYFAYNWFWNNSTAGEPAPTATPGGPTSTPAPTALPPYSGIPTFKIAAVVKDTNVKILTNNFPKDQNFTVRMGAYGTQGVGGTVVATTNSGAGGAFEATYDIPASLAGAQRIAIRLESPAGYFAYNWFWNANAP